MAATTLNMVTRFFFPKYRENNFRDKFFAKFRLVFVLIFAKVCEIRTKIFARGAEGGRRRKGVGIVTHLVEFEVGSRGYHVSTT